MQGTGVQLDKKHWWNQQVQTYRTIPNNKPDIIIRDNEAGTCMLIDVAIGRQKM